MKKIKILLSFIIGLTFHSCNYEDEINALNSMEKLGDGLYFIEFIGDYDFDNFLKVGASTNEELTDYLIKSLSKGKWKSSEKENQIKIKNPNFACSSIIAKNKEGKSLFGRNYDWKDCSIMIIHTKPDNGYESISTSCMEFLGVDRNWNPQKKFPQDIIALASIYVPLDGMNEKGLYVADLVAGDNEKTAQKRGKLPLTITTAIRLLLDKAATVDEAIALLDSYDMNSVIDTAHHFIIADKSGKSIVVEWVDNKIYFSESSVLTNHYVTKSPKEGVFTYENSKERYNKLLEWGDNHNWIMDCQEVKEALKSVSAGHYDFDTNEITVWSSVYEPENKRITYYIREDYENPLVIEF